MTEHPDTATIELFAIGGLEPDENFVAHLAACSDCSKRLAEEARLELALIEARTQQRAGSASGARSRKLLWGVVPAVALAAAAVLLFLLRSPSVGMRPDPKSGQAINTEQPLPEADAVIANLRPRFRMCYQDGLAKDPTMAGRAVIAAVVGAGGDVLSAVVRSNEGLSTEVAACLAEVVRRAHFTGTGRETEIVVPVAFTQAKR